MRLPPRCPTLCLHDEGWAWFRVSDHSNARWYSLSPDLGGPMAEAAPLTFLCITTYEKGQEFMRECKRHGCRVLLLTAENLRNADWPRAERTAADTDERADGMPPGKRARADSCQIKTSG